jgi:sugar-specific transcriptional regulator TrmB
MKTKELLAESLHLNKAEVDIYIAALEHSQNTVSRLAGATKIPRTAVYGPLKKLIERGFINETKLNKRKYYQAVPPQHLPKIVERETSGLELAIADLTQMIDVPQDEMTVRHFRGSQGFLSAVDIVFDTAKPGSVLRTVENPELTFMKYTEELLDTYREVRIKKNVFAQIINPTTKSTPWLEERRRNLERELCDNLIISADEYPLTAGFAVNGNNLLIMNYRSVPSATLITNHDIARTFDSLHRAIWDRFKK